MKLVINGHCMAIKLPVAAQAALPPAQAALANGSAGGDFGACAWSAGPGGAAGGHGAAVVMALGLTGAYRKSQKCIDAKKLFHQSWFFRKIHA